MKTNIFHFKPKNELAVEQNICEFILKCKDELTVFGGSLVWEDWIWPNVARFNKLGSGKRRQESDKFAESFMDFAKAYVRYQHGHRPKKDKVELIALRTIEAALTQVNGSADISCIDITVLDEAIQLALAYYSIGKAYECGRQLERLANFLSDMNLVKASVGHWASPIQRPVSNLNKVGKKAKIEREKKLPTLEALNALAEIFSLDPSDPKDIFTSSVCAMLMAAPSRISEILALPVDCEVTEIDSKGIERYGWRFYSAKGYEGNIKWIPTTMVEIAQEAIKRIRGMTEESRQLAKWIENNPNKFYRHSGCPDVAEDHPLTLRQSCQALGLASPTDEVCRNGLIRNGLGSKANSNTLSRLWKYVISEVPVEFPWLYKEYKIKYSNALFCMSRNILHKRHGTSPVILWAPTNSMFNYDLSPKNGHKKHRSIFDRYGYKGTDGARIKLTSHQFRHLLNTIAQRGGLSQLEIAKWSGRANVSQNRIYNHMSEYEMVAEAESLDTNQLLYGPSGELSQYNPIQAEEFNYLEKRPAHVTEFGLCIHDFTMTPCEKYRDCLNCNEQVCIKGDADKLFRIRARLSKIEGEYTKAKVAMECGEAGADRWYEYHAKTFRRLQELVLILEDSTFPEGTQIKLRSDSEFSQIRRTLRVKLDTLSEMTEEESDMSSGAIEILGDGLG